MYEPLFAPPHPLFIFVGGEELSGNNVWGRADVVGQRIRGWHARPGDDVMFTNIREPVDIQRVIIRMKEIALSINRPDGLRSIVIGMPNTGKSSMLNVIRRHATDRKCTSPISFGGGC
jgi:ribosome biogenesis GTPase A